MTQIFGEFVEASAKSKEYLVLGFSPSSIPLKQRWRNNGLSADFIGNYLTTFFPATHDNKMCYKPTEIKSAVSYIANELLENAMKYNDETQDYSINIRLELLNNNLRFYVTNSISSATMEQLKKVIQELLSEDPQKLYFCRLEQNAINTKTSSIIHSGLGLLTMLNDYMAKLGWKFEIIQQDPQVITVTTMVELTL
jgi:hypothetical protein